MISQNEILNIICTEAIEFGGLQEVPGHKHGGKNSFHAAKRGARGPDDNHRVCSDSEFPTVHYALRLVKETDGTLNWKD